MMRVNSFIRQLFLVFLIGFLLSCTAKEDSSTRGKDSETTASTGGVAFEDPDKQAISEMLIETIERFRYNDKGGFYDNELPFLREKLTFDEYLHNDFISEAKADSVVSFEILEINLFKPDSARIKDRVTFVGTLGDTHFLNNEYTVYYQGGRWIKPTISFLNGKIYPDI